MNSGTLISIIVPYYNCFDGLQRLLQSIPMERDDVEVIVIDDNSLDQNQIDLIKKSVVLVTKCVTKNKGAGSSRNIGLSIAKGDWILFADADDWFTDSAFGVLEQLNLPCASQNIFYFPPTSFNLINKTKGKRHKRYAGLVKSKSDEIRVKFHVPWSKLYNRKFLVENNICFDEVIASNDVMFSLKSGLLARSFVFIDKEIYCVSESNNSLTKQNEDSVIDTRFDVIVRYNKMLVSYGMRQKQISWFQYALTKAKWKFRLSFKYLKIFMNEGLLIFPRIKR